MNLLKILCVVLVLLSNGLCLDPEFVGVRREPAPVPLRLGGSSPQPGQNLHQKRSVDGNKLPDIVTQSGEVRVISGETARLGCQVSGLGKYILMWKEGKRVISAGSLMVRKDSRFRLSVLDSSYVLSISNVNREDAGEYICEVDVLGRPLRVTQNLEVLVPPRVQPRESEVHLTKGQNYTLSCSGQGYPNPRITWTRQDGYLSSGDIEGLSLPLVNVTRQMAGRYICSASNGVASTAKAHISVFVKYPPEIEVEQVWIKTDKGTEVEIDCIVHSNPPPQVTWFRESGKIFETDRVLMTEKVGRWSVKIISLREEDFGNYSCRASNSLGRDQQYIVLSGRPTPPKFTSPSLNFNAGVYNLTWAAEAFSPVTEYKLRYKQSKDTQQENGVWSEVVMPVPDPSAGGQYYVLRQLLPGTVYDVVGFAKNKYGWSQPSKTFTFFNKGVDFSTQELIKSKEREKEKLESLKREEMNKLSNIMSSGFMTRVGVSAATLVLCTLALL